MCMIAVKSATMYASLSCSYYISTMPAHCITITYHQDYHKNTDNSIISVLGFLLHPHHILLVKVVNSAEFVQIGGQLMRFILYLRLFKNSG